MGRLRLGDLPRMSRHPSGQARVRVGREEHWLGRFGSPEAQRRYDAIIRRILDQRNASVVPAAPPVAVEPEAAPENASAANCTDAAIAAPPAYAAAAEESTEPGDVTVAEVCSSFLRYAEREYRDATGRPTSTIGNYKMAVRALRPYDDVSANAFNAPLFKDMIQRLVNEVRPARSEGKAPQRWPRQTINRIAKSVRFIFQWAVTEELVSPDVPGKLKAVKLLARHRTTAPERGKVKPVLDENIERTLPHLPTMVADMVRVQRYTGCRPGEVCAMICGEVDRSGATWVWRPEQHKNAWRGHEREIAIGPQARRILGPYLERRPDEYVFIASESQAARNRQRRAGRTSPMTPSHKARRKQAVASRRRRTPYTESAYRRAIARACEKHGIPRWHPNQIRHTTGTEVRGKAGLEAAQVRLGHKSAKTTEIYAELRLERQIEIAEMYG